MNVTFTHGPDRTPLDWSDDGSLQSVSGTPFHGIASRGLLPWLEGRPDGEFVWAAFGHLIHEPGATPDPALLALREAAHEAGVLSLSQSARAAHGFVTDRCIPGWEKPVESVDLWNMKEGHTSSVWLVTIDPADRAPTRFVVNVARDDRAGEELRQTSQVMQALATRFPDLPIAAVDEIATVSITTGVGTREVTVTRNAWVPGALEIHCLPGTTRSPERYVFVERFITDEEAPSRIRAVRGRVATASEQETIAGTIRQFRHALLPSDCVSLDINDGDLVWNGESAVIVAVGAS